MKTGIKNEVVVTARAKPFRPFPVGTYKFLVTESDVKPWDSIAGHYTGCNSLSDSAKRRIAKLARNA